jgi:hypothetical protein
MNMKPGAYRPRPPSDYSTGPSMAVGDENRALPIINKGEKYPKEAVSYRYARDPAQASCGLCVNFDGQSSCRKVIGLIRPPDWCVLFEPSGRPYDDYDADLDDSEGARMPTYGKAGISGSRPIAAPGVGSAPLNPKRAGIAGSKPVGMVPLDEQAPRVVRARRVLDEPHECDATCAHQLGVTTPTPKRKSGQFNRATLQKLIEDVRRKCDALEREWCHPDQDVASRAIEAWRQSYELKRALRTADDQVRQSQEAPSTRAYANLAIREFYKNYKR